MIFSQAEFFVFFGVVFALYMATRRQLTVQNLLIVLASYVFYAWWDPRFLILIAISTSTDYLAGLAVGDRQIRRGHLLRSLGLVWILTAILALLRVDGLTMIVGAAGAFTLASVAFHLVTSRMADATRRRAWLVASIVTNLGLLGVFKYFNFFADSFAQFVGVFGWEPSTMTLNVVLPVGISFYTFQTMSYTLDISRRQLKPTDDFLRFAAFVSFFPQLVAGPIERATALLPQFEVAREVTAAKIRSGAMLFLWGFYKKRVIADNLGPISDTVFANPAAASPDQILAGVLAFTFQIYGDFSGYSDMARGTARMLGFELMLNFRMPYFSRTPSEFWQRWHISLSSWLRDYLYIPLGGNRGGPIKTYRNLMATMVIGGLWHGAAWTFVAWGFFHGAILVVYRLLNIDRWLSNVSTSGVAGLAGHVVAGTFMFTLVVVSWVFFRAQSFGDAFYILGNMHHISPYTLGEVAFYMVPLLLIELYGRLTAKTHPWEGAPKWLQFHLVLFLACAAVFLAARQSAEFIYFDF